MAKGGFSYSYHATPGSGGLGPYTATLDGILTSFDALPDWSIGGAAATYATSNRVTWGWMSHTSGAKFVFAWMGDDAGGSDIIIHADNDWLDVDRSTNEHEYTMFVAYVPPNGGVLTGTPASAGFLPSGSFGFVNWPVYAENRYTNVTRDWHFAGKGDLLWIAHGNTVGSIDSVLLAGPWMSPNASDITLTGDVERNIFIAATETSPRTGAYTSSAFSAGVRGMHTRETGDLLTASRLSIPSSALNTSVQSAPPYFSEKVLVFRENSLGSGNTGLYNLVKGHLDPEVARGCLTDLAQKTQVDGGNFIHVRDGLYLGWDPGIGAMS